MCLKVRLPLKKELNLSLHLDCNHPLLTLLIRQAYLYYYIVATLLCFQQTAITPAASLRADNIYTSRVIAGASNNDCIPYVNCIMDCDVSQSITQLTTPRSLQQQPLPSPSSYMYGKNMTCLGYQTKVIIHLLKITGCKINDPSEVPEEFIGSLLMLLQYCQSALNGFNSSYGARSYFRHSIVTCQKLSRYL